MRNIAQLLTQSHDIMNSTTKVPSNEELIEFKKLPEGTDVNAIRQRKKMFESGRGLSEEEATARNKVELAQKQYEIDKLKSKYLHQERQELKGVLLEMANEQPESSRLNVDEVEHLVTSLQLQRNNALNRVAVEQARNKSLLVILNKKDHQVRSLEAKIKELETTLEATHMAVQSVSKE